MNKPVLTLFGAVLLVIFCDFLYLLISVIFQFDKMLLNNAFNIYIFDSAITHVILLIIIIVLFKVLKIQWKDFLKIEKKLIYLIPIIIISGIIIVISGRFLFLYLSQFLSDTGVMDRNVEVYSNLNSVSAKLIYFAVLGFLTPVSEELFMRAYAYTVIRRKYNVFVAILFNTIIFILFHPIPSLIPVIILTNIILCLSFEYTKNLFVPMILHSVINSYNIFG